jgi:hypothetical protein
VPTFSLLLAAAGVAAFVVGFLRTSLGAGIGLVLTPTLSLVLPPSAVLALITPMMNLSDPITLRYYWRRWDARQLWLVMPTSLVGVALGTWADGPLRRRAAARGGRRGGSPHGRVVRRLALGRRDPEPLSRQCRPADGRHPRHGLGRRGVRQRREAPRVLAHRLPHA